MKKIRKQGSRNNVITERKEIMDNSLFYMNFEPSEEQKSFIESIKETAIDNINPVYVIRKPITEKQTTYENESYFVVMMPKHKLMFFDYGNDEDEFEDYIDDFTEDVGYSAKKYEFLKILGRSRQWKESLVYRKHKGELIGKNFLEIMHESEIQDQLSIRKGEILISLATGSINEAAKLGEGVPSDVLEQIKRKIILFDGEQTKFIFNEPKKKRITIQGLAGTGKTELLLHKIKELYINDQNNRIVFTCHNEILADSLRKRVPAFFDFMKVEEQIKWNEKLWVMRSWGSQIDFNSGVYSFICHWYNIPFSRFSYNTSFNSICMNALFELEQKEKFECCFDYMLIDESQDFPEAFFKLCEKVTEKCVYVAGDIFQDIFENKPLSVVAPDFLLNKCYRTDPRTLMGAHAIGMGLFEKRLRWLDDEEWEACGYKLLRKDDKVELHRKPLRRFEDIDIRSTNGIELVQIENSQYLETILAIIDNIINKYPSVTPDDIGIMFMENMESNYTLATQLEVLVKERFGWDANIGYETKERRKGTLFISNRNNVKGLEFPFVICIMQGALSEDFQMRNSIYMMLTRSFLTSYLVISSGNDYSESMLEGIAFVNENGYLRVDEPNDSEKNALRNAIIARTNLHKSQREIAEEIMDEIGVKNSHRERLMKLIRVMCPEEVGREKLYNVIHTNYILIE